MVSISGGTLLSGKLTSTAARVSIIFDTLPGWWMGQCEPSKEGKQVLIESRRE